MSKEDQVERITVRLTKAQRQWLRATAGLLGIDEAKLAQMLEALATRNHCTPEQMAVRLIERALNRQAHEFSAGALRLVPYEA